MNVNRIKSICYVFVFCSYLTCLVRAESKTLKLDVPDGHLAIALDNGGVILKSLNHTDAGNESTWIDSQPAIPLWTITILDSQKKKQELTGAGAKTSLREIPDGIAMEWNGVQPGDLNVRVTVSKIDNVFEWNLECELKAPGYTLWDVTFPEIGPLNQSDSFHAIIPYGWGYIPDDVKSRRHFGIYPSATRAMPFVGVSDGKAGIYLGVHESAGYPFGLFVGKYADTEGVSLGIRHDVEGMGNTVRYCLPYSVTTRLFAGDWYECARIYRKAAQATPWGNIPPIEQRSDIPSWLKDTDLWYIGSCHDEKTADDIIAFASYFEVPTSAHVYQWHEIPFDDHYPEYFPAKPGFVKAVEKVQQAGIAVMPYINGRLWDSATDSWKELDARTACAIDENGEKYVEVYGSKVPLSPMCPYTELWKTTVTHLVDRLLDECKVKAVYIDQISAASAKRCFSGNHGHPVGGGTYWIQGYRDLIRRCLAVCPPGTALTTEENADPWNDLLQAWLLVNSPRSDGKLVPIYPAVYSGRAISFGFQYILGDDLPLKYPFRLKMAQAFVFGSQLGWIGSQVLEERFAMEAEFMKRLCLARHASRDALQFGELLPPIPMEGGGTVSWTNEENKKLEQNAVLASAWLTPDGIRKIAITNIADDERTVLITLDQSHLGILNKETVTLRSEDKKTTALLKKDESRWQGKISMPAREANVLVLN